MVFLLYIIFLTANIPSSATEQQKLNKEYAFQFNLQNKKNWDDYRITENEEGALSGEANGCSQRIPVIFKRLCVQWNDDHGFSLALQPSHNLNIDPNYDDMLWYYRDHKTAKNADKAAQTKGESEMPLRRRLMSKDAAQCFWFNDARACARIDPSNQQSMAVSVGINDDNDVYGFGAAYDDYSDNDDYQESDDNEDYNYNQYYQGYGDIGGDYYDDYEYYQALTDLYTEYMQQQTLYNQQWMNYWNNMYLQNMVQQQQQYNGYVANAYGGGEGDNMAIAESNVIHKAEEEARKKVEERVEKKLENKFEAKMMSKLEQDMEGYHHTKKSQHNGGGGGGSNAYVHRSQSEDEDDPFGNEGRSPPPGIGV